MTSDAVAVWARISAALVQLMLRGCGVAMRTVIGLASLVGPAATALLGGQTFAEAFGDGGQLRWAFIVVRLAHIACVMVASVLMFTPSANAYFAVTGRRRSGLVGISRVAV